MQQTCYQYICKIITKICYCAISVCVCILSNNFTNLEDILGSRRHYLGLEAVDWDTLVVIHSVP